MSKKNFNFLFFILILVFCTGCKKLEREMMVLTGNTEAVSYKSAKVSGNIIDVGDGILHYGHCYGTNPDLNIHDDSKTEFGAANKTGVYSSEFQDLQPGVKYYVKSFITDGKTTKYGEEKSFMTLAGGPAIINTNPVTEVHQRTAICGGDVTNDGGAPILARGVCWNTTGSPTILNNKTVDGQGTGSYISEIGGLTVSTQYFVRAYATNAIETSYGAEIPFTTDPLALPVLVTNLITSLTTNSAISGGHNIMDGGADILEKGICYSPDGTPTINDIKILNGAGPADFTSNLTGLMPNFLYHVRAYAITSVGTGYGNQIDFLTDFTCGTSLTDQRDGKTYLTKQYGNQCWMTANMNIGIRVNGSLDQKNDGIIEKYCYDNNEVNCDTYGGLYQWDEMMQYKTADNTQGVCPVGWHIPSDFEWKIFEVYLGMSQQVADGTFWRGTNEGGKIKAAGTTYWVAPNTGATNSTLFTALPAGDRTSTGTFEGLSSFTDFWTSTLIIDTQCWYRYLHTDESRIYRIDGNTRYATSVRCIRNQQ